MRRMQDWGGAGREERVLGDRESESVPAWRDGQRELCPYACKNYHELRHDARVSATTSHAQVAVRRRHARIC